jgi:hypothetical protein
MKIKCLLSFAFVLFFAIASPSFAQTYTLGYDQTRYTVDENDTVDIDVILREEVSGAEVARFAPGGDDNFFSLALAIDYSAFTGGTTGSTFVSDSLVRNSGLGDNFSSAGGITDDPGLLSFEVIEDFGSDPDGEPGIVGTQVDANTWEINLATVTFNAGDLGTTTTLQLRDHVAGDDAIRFSFFGDNANDPVRSINYTSGEIFVGAIPEPGSVSLISLLAGIGFVRRRRS